MSIPTLISEQSADADIVQACIDGDPRAWELLVRKNSPLVYSIARSYRFSAFDAEDVLQIVWSIAFQRLAGLKDRGRLSSWLATTTHRECWRLHKRNPLPTHEITEEPLDQQDVRDWEAHFVVHRALEELGDPCRTLLEALFSETTPPKYEIVAGTLGLPLGSIGPMRARCLTRLRDIIERIDQDETMQESGD